MAILATCDSCGQKVKLDDKRVGSTAQCPACKTRFQVQALGTGSTIKFRPQPAPGKQLAVSFNWIPISWAAGFVTLIGVIALIYFGPVRTKREWDAISGTACDTMTDVVQRAVAYQKEQDFGPFDPAKNNKPPAVIGVQPLWSGVAISMPEYVDFIGTSTEGPFTGKYYLQTGEVVASANMGGTVVANLMVTRGGDKKISITGRRKGTQLQVEVGGTKVPP